MSNQSTAIDIRKKQSASLKDLMVKALPQITAVMPKHLSPEKLMRVALVACNRTPKLLECSPQSVLQAVMQAATLGLQVDGVLGHGYLVPFKGTCQFIPGYRGLIDLARRGGHVVTVEAHVVRENDDFKFSFGLIPLLEHKPSYSDQEGKIIAVYAIARMRDGGVQYDVMTRREVDAIRARSRSGNDGPWVTDYPEMARKTVVRRLCKYLPLNAELAAALELDNRAEGSEQSYSEILDGEFVDVPSEEPPKSKLADRARAEKAPPVPEKPEPGARPDNGAREPGEEG